jgi:uroporphyrinogen-III synthase
MPRLLVTRPEADARPLAEALSGLGVDSMIEPLLEIVALDGPPPDVDGVQALLATSANGIRAFAARSRERSLPVCAVGDGTAAEARRLGFDRVETAGGDVEALAALVIQKLKPGQGSLLHVAASAVAGDLKGRLESAGFGYRRAVLYEARTAERLSAATERALREASLDGALFFSPRTARTFVTLVERLEATDACRRLTAYCLSEAVAAAAAALPWGGTVVADRPSRAALLEAVGRRMGAAGVERKRT